MKLNTVATLVAAQVINDETACLIYAEIDAQPKSSGVKMDSLKEFADRFDKLPPSTLEKIINELAASNRIAAIKILRDATNWDVATSKAFADMFMKLRRPYDNFRPY